MTSQIVNPAYGNSNDWWVGRTLGWALHVSKSKPSAGVFISLYFWWKPTVSENFGCHFNFILHIMSDKAAFVRGALFWNLELSRSNSASCWQIINLPSKTPSKLFANHNALGQLTNHNTFRFSEGGPSSNPELIEPFVWGWGERYCNNVKYVKNNAIFEPPSMRACSSTPPKQNQDFVKEHNRTPLTITGEIPIWIPAYVRSLTVRDRDCYLKRLTLTDETRSADPHMLLLKRWTIWQDSLRLSDSHLTCIVKTNSPCLSSHEDVYIFQFQQATICTATLLFQEFQVFQPQLIITMYTITYD